jgi:hypothetical protein
MSFDISLPNISATSEAGKIEQIKSYLQQLAEQLKWALNSIQSSGNTVVYKGNQTEVKDASDGEAQATFNSVKALIISSTDVISAYYDEIEKRLSGLYVAQSDFGTYTEQTDAVISASSQAISAMFTNLQEIISDIENLEHSLIDVTANLKAGILYYDDAGVPIYGLEIGQKNEIDGVEVFNKYARFTSDRLSFYDQNDTEVAYISDYKLHITNAQITGTLTLGRFEFDTSDGLICRWV